MLADSSGGDEGAQKWMQEQKLKLVAAKKAERDAETAQYKQQQGKQVGITYRSRGCRWELHAGHLSGRHLIWGACHSSRHGIGSGSIRTGGTATAT